MPANFIEFVESRSVSTAGFSIEGGRATLMLDLDDEDLESAIIELLGSCASNGLGGLTRVLPMAHPQFPWLFCERISNIQGLSPESTYSTAAPDLDAPSLPFYQGYARYRLTCEFMPRPYAVLPDSSIVFETATVYDDTGAGTAITFPNEWTRFVDIQTDAKPELITAQQGQMAYWRDDANEPNALTFPGFPRIYLQNGQVRMYWRQVPERYVRSRASNLKRFIGRVNKTAFLEWDAGELLYLGFTQKRYVPPIPERIVDANEPTVFSTAKLVDLELLFEETVRTLGAAFTPSNANWVVGGHNLQPWLRDRTFFYAGMVLPVPPPTAASPGNAASTAPGSKYPTYLSFDTRYLFRDPDL